jgi:hypothetical protein
VLFSQVEAATLIQTWFEPVWESVRPVPLVHFDFGNGRKVTRTLNGNIATWVCDADGTALDVLPGIYTPEAYRDRLNQFRLLHNYIGKPGTADREKRLKAYHEGQAEALKKNENPPRLVNMADFSKSFIEGGIKAVLVKGGTPQVESKSGDVKGDLAGWKELVEDTRLNETVRRREIHDILAAAGVVRPERLTKRLYKEVLHADLDDPYLGLGNVLIGTDPFRKDRTH